MKYTMQEAFARAASKIIAQGRPSIEGDVITNGWCLYNGPEGCRCAIGWLAPDDSDLQNVMDECGIEEGCDPGEFLDAFHIHVELEDESDFLDDLQFCHDQAEVGPGFVDDFKRLMRRVAKMYRLDASCLEKA